MNVILIKNAFFLQIEVSCILGGMQTVCHRFPHLITSTKKLPTATTTPTPTPTQSTKKFRRLSLSSTFSISSMSSLSDSRTNSTVSVDKAYDVDRKLSTEIPWMPTLVLGNNVFLGRREQSDDPRVIQSLGITDVVSIGRYLLSLA